MLVLGIHDGHNASAALVRDGRVVAAIQEERLSRIKNHDAFPRRAVRAVLEQAGVAPGDLDVIALNGAHQPRHRTRQQLMDAVRAAGAETMGAALKRLARNSPVYTLFRGLRKAEREREVAEAGLPADRVRFVDHHESHAAAAHWGAPWREGPTLVLTCDGAGDDLCATVSVADGGRIDRRFEVAEEHSIGMVYLTATQVLGMVPNEHEYKVMGLAPYAKHEALQSCHEFFLSLMEFEGGAVPQWRRRAGTPHAFGLYKFLRDGLEGYRFDVVAGALQKWTTEMLCAWTRLAIAATGVRRVALSGGCFMNVKANQAIGALDEVDDLFVFPSCGDESNAVGAALAATAQYNPNSPSSPSAPSGPSRPFMSQPEPIGPIYWGRAFSQKEIDAAVASAGDGFEVRRADDPTAAVADLLAAGEIVARFDGPAEFGARSLGNRSLLADPSRLDLVRRLNDAIKNRDFWMPFAPTVLAERAGDYLVNPKGLDAPYMILAFDTTDRRADLPAAIHPYDQTARPQVLAESDNPAYHALLKAFESRTGRGALLNTSFNLHGFPMVYAPEDAFDVMRQSGLRWLQMGDCLIEKS